MIELSFANVNNGLRNELHMNCWCIHGKQAAYIFNRAIDLYRNWDPKFIVSQNPFALSIGGIHIQFSSWQSATNKNFKGFRGIHLIHPELSMNFTKQQDFDLYDEMSFHNERYLDQWRS